MAEITKTVKPSGQGGDYTTLAGAISGMNGAIGLGNFLTISIQGDWSGGPDTSPVTIPDSMGIGVQQIRIVADSANRATGTWDPRRYRLKPGSGSAAIETVNDQGVTIIGLQIEIARAMSSIYISYDSDGGASDNFVSNCHVYHTGSGYKSGNNSIINLIGTTKFSNNFIEGASIGFLLQTSTAYTYNNTCLDCTTGFRINGGDAYDLRNNATFQCTNGYVLASAPASVTQAYNCSSDSTWTNGSGGDSSYQNMKVSFNGRSAIPTSNALLTKGGNYWNSGTFQENSVYLLNSDLGFNARANANFSVGAMHGWRSLNPTFSFGGLL